MFHLLLLLVCLLGVFVFRSLVCDNHLANQWPGLGEVPGVVLVLVVAVLGAVVCRDNGRDDGC